MTITVAWDNEAKTIIRINRTNPWDWTDFDRGVDASYALIRSVDNIVYIINIIDPGDRMPEGLPLPHITRLMQLRPENAGPTLVVGPQNPHQFGTIIFSAARKAKKGVAETLQSVESLEEAYAIVAELQQKESEIYEEQDSGE